MMMSLPKKIFITGTDTGVGKTHISAALLNYFSQQGLSTLGIKPLASGGDEDALILQKAASMKLTTQQINPLRFTPPIAPHIAAEQTQQSLSVSQLMQQCEFALNYPVDFCLVEGVGGWLTPLNSQGRFC
jgi:dethiobiotin synthetase